MGQNPGGKRTRCEAPAGGLPVWTLDLPGPLLDGVARCAGVGAAARAGDPGLQTDRRVQAPQAELARRDLRRALVRRPAPVARRHLRAARHVRERRLQVPRRAAARIQRRRRVAARLLRAAALLSARGPGHRRARRPVAVPGVGPGAPLRRHRARRGSDAIARDATSTCLGRPPPGLELVAPSRFRADDGSVPVPADLGRMVSRGEARDVACPPRCSRS